MYKLELDESILPLQEIETEEQSSSDALALKVSCGRCGNPLGHEFVKDGPNGKSRFDASILKEN